MVGLCSENGYSMAYSWTVTKLYKGILSEPYIGSWGMMERWGHNLNTVKTEYQLPSYRTRRFGWTCWLRALPAFEKTHKIYIHIVNRQLNNRITLVFFRNNIFFPIVVATWSQSVWRFWMNNVSVKLKATTVTSIIYRSIVSFLLSAYSTLYQGMSFIFSFLLY